MLKAGMLFNGQPLTQEQVDEMLRQRSRSTHVIRNAASSAGRIVKAAVTGRRVTVSDQERERRLGICRGCEFYTGKTCRKCGCVIRFKAKLATEHCPINKW